MGRLRRECGGVPSSDPHDPTDLRRSASCGARSNSNTGLVALTFTSTPKNTATVAEPAPPTGPPRPCRTPCTRTNLIGSPCVRSVVPDPEKVLEKRQEIGGGRSGEVLEGPGVTAEDDTDEGGDEQL